MVKGSNAVTLIALIITIIVLLVLAAVTINMVLGENGLYNKAKTSVAKYENAQEKENISLDTYENEIDRYNTNNENKSILEIWLNKADLDLNNYSNKTIEGILADQSVCDALMNSQDAIEYMLNNKALINSVINSSTAMNAIAGSSMAMTALGASEYGAYKVITSSFFNNIMSSIYVDNFDAGTISVPNMGTSNTNERGTALRSNPNAGPAYRAFDKSSSTVVSTRIGTSDYIAFDFGEPLIAYKVKVFPEGTAAHSCKGGYIAYSDNNNPNALTDLQTFSNSNMNNWNTFIINNRQAHRIWGIDNLLRYDGASSRK